MIPSIVFFVKNLHQIIHTIVPHAGHNTVGVGQRQLEDVVFNHNLHMYSTEHTRTQKQFARINSINQQTMPNEVMNSAGSRRPLRICC